MNLVLLEKLKAAGIHLLISCGLAFSCFIVVFFVLYPSPLAQATGVGMVFLIMLGVDVVLGPMLTLIVYKKSLYTTNFTEPLSYQDSAFLKLPKFP